MYSDRDREIDGRNLYFQLIIRLIAEIPATGGVITSFSIRTLKLSTFLNTENYFMMFCKILFLIMVCW